MPSRDLFAHGVQYQPVEDRPMHFVTFQGFVDFRDGVYNQGPVTPTIRNRVTTSANSRVTTTPNDRVTT